MGDYIDVSENRGTPKSSILKEFSIINHPNFGYPYFWKHPYVTCGGSRGVSLCIFEVQVRGDRS